MAHLCATVNKVFNDNYRKERQQQQKLNGEEDANGDDETIDSNPRKIKLISSSGGNAGLAVATVARNIPNMDVCVIVPETTKTLVVQKLRSLGAEVTVHGANWNAADALARERVEEANKVMGEGHAVYIRYARAKNVLSRRRRVACFFRLAHLLLDIMMH